MSAPDVDALLREHYATVIGNRWACRCGWTNSAPIINELNEHRAHQAAIITAAYAETLAGVRAEALREAADDAGCEACGHAPTDGGCPWCHSGVTVAQSGRPSSTRDGACICDYNPETADGPQEECPFHGRPYEYWIQRAEAAEVKVAQLRAALDVWELDKRSLHVLRAVGEDLRAALADPEATVAPIAPPRLCEPPPTPVPVDGSGDIWFRYDPDADDGPEYSWIKPGTRVVWKNEAGEVTVSAVVGEPLPRPSYADEFTFGFTIKRDETEA